MHRSRIAQGEFAMDDTLLRADCGSCVALCCVGLAFDRSEHFGFAKLAGEPCRHLDVDYRCEIHDRLGPAGMGGCIAFDCFGAGQRVTAQFAGRSWRDDPAVASEMFDAFRRMRRAHELIGLLRTAGRLRLSAEQETRRAALETAITDATAAPEITALDAEISTFLAGLKDLVPRTRQRAGVDS